MSAQKALDIASQKADEVISTKGYTGICMVCEGQGFITLTMTTSKGKTSTTELSCSACKGNKTITQDEEYRLLCRRGLWCGCEKATPHLTRDGRKVFGNETYVCGRCHLVVQFG